MGKASMVGFTLLSRSYYYLRRRSPGPPFPPDHRQAGERGAKKKFEKDIYQRKEAIYAKYVEDYKVETSYGRHKIIKMKLPKSFKQQFISEPKKLAKRIDEPKRIEDQTQRLFT